MGRIWAAWMKAVHRLSCLSVSFFSSHTQNLLHNPDILISRERESFEFHPFLLLGVRVAQQHLKIMARRESWRVTSRLPCMSRKNQETMPAFAHASACKSQPTNVSRPSGKRTRRDLNARLFDSRTWEQLCTTFLPGRDKAVEQEELPKQRGLKIVAIWEHGMTDIRQMPDSRGICASQGKRFCACDSCAEDKKPQMREQHIQLEQSAVRYSARWWVRFQNTSPLLLWREPTKERTSWAFANGKKAYPRERGNQERTDK